MVFVPLAFAVFAALIGRDLHLGFWPVAKVVLGRALVPLLIGIGVARFGAAVRRADGAAAGQIVDADAARPAGGRARRHLARAAGRRRPRLARLPSSPRSGRS